MAFIRALWQEFPDFVQKNINPFYQYWFEIVKTANIGLNLEGICICLIIIGHNLEILAIVSRNIIFKIFAWRGQDWIEIEFGFHPGLQAERLALFSLLQDRQKYFRFDFFCL